MFAHFCATLSLYGLFNPIQSKPYHPPDEWTIWTDRQTYGWTDQHICHKQHMKGCLFNVGVYICQWTRCSSSLYDVPNNTPIYEKSIHPRPYPMSNTLVVVYISERPTSNGFSCLALCNCPVRYCPLPLSLTLSPVVILLKNDMQRTEDDVGDDHDSDYSEMFKNHIPCITKSKYKHVYCMLICSLWEFISVNILTTLKEIRNYHIYRYQQTSVFAQIVGMNKQELVYCRKWPSRFR